MEETENSEFTRKNTENISNFHLKLFVKNFKNKIR